MMKWGIGWMALAAIAIAAQGILGVRSFVEQKRTLEAREEVGRLANITTRIFVGRKPPTGKDFWKELGRSEPLRDPWGSAYTLESSRAGLRWRCAGPDRMLSTADDILRAVPHLEDKQLIAPAPEESTAMPVNPAY